MLHLIAAAIGDYSGSAGSVTADWSDIVIDGDPFASGTSSSTVVFTGGGSRNFQVTHAISTGALSVKVGAAAYVSCPSGTTFSTTTGTTVIFRYICGYMDETAVVTVTDTDLTATADTFNCEFTFG